MHMGWHVLKTAQAAKQDLSPQSMCYSSSSGPAEQHCKNKMEEDLLKTTTFIQTTRVTI